ncbi:MAG: DUF480 domain-containing protein [Planctomycetota bacterium]|nr:MAG: DUF480 domain-containing protein [Planctomycetota bacterium]
MQPAPVLDPVEARVLGVLVEKALTTPDQYPLSLHALAAGCNQKSNRHPVLDLPEPEVADAVERLRVKRLALVVHTAGGRVERFGQQAMETLGIHKAELAVLAELLLRGPQQPGELRGRAERMHPLATLEELSAVLDSLSGKGYARRLAPEPGARAPRYAHAFGAAADADAAAPAPPAGATAAEGAGAELEQRVAALEQEIARLARHVVELAARVESGSGPRAG